MYVAQYSIDSVVRRTAADRMCAVAQYYNIYSKADRGDILIIHDQKSSSLINLTKIHNEITSHYQAAVLGTYKTVSHACCSGQFIHRTEQFFCTALIHTIFNIQKCINLNMLTTYNIMTTLTFYNN